MKKVLLFIGFGFMVIAVSLFSSCKKDKSGSNSVIPANTTPAYVPPQPGYLKFDISSLTLNKGTNKLILPVLHNSDNSIANPQPSFLWHSDNDNIATVINGQITTIDTGFTSISVTDGIHGVLNINLKVVPENSNISSDPSQIVFNTVAGIMGNNAIALLPNSTRNISYTIFDVQGNIVNATPVFYTTSSVPFSINGDAISSSSILGIWDVKAKIGSKLLSGNLKVIVFQSDTNKYINPIRGTFPEYFYKPDLASAIPLVITYNKVWYSYIDGFHWYVEVVSPDQIISNFPDVISSNAAGYIISKAAGRTRLTIKYKEDTLSYFARVGPLLLGNWGGTTPDYVFNFCFNDEINWNIVYRDYEYEDNYFSVRYGTQFIIKQGVNLTNPIPGENYCTFYDNIDWHFEGQMTNTGLGVIRFFSPSSTYDVYTYWNKGIFLVNEPPYGSPTNIKYPLANGAGNCSGGGGPTDTTCFSNWYVDGVFKHGSGPGNSEVYIINDHSEFTMRFKAQGGDSCSIGGLFFPSKGTYAITLNVEPCSAQYWKSDGTGEHDADTGTLIITAADSNHISGTFNFVDEADPLSVTNGKFNSLVINYTPSKSKRKMKK